MWYRCNVKDHGSSLYASRDDAARGGQQAALRQPLLVKQNTATRVAEVQPNAAAFVQGRADLMIDYQEGTLEHPSSTTIAGSGAQCTPGLLVTTTGDSSSTSTQMSDSCPAPPAYAAFAQNTCSFTSLAPPAAAAASESPADPAGANQQHAAAPPIISGSGASFTSAAAAKLPHPILAEVELQKSTIGGDRSSAAVTASLFSDPLLHWNECWAGPGLNSRRSSAHSNPRLQPPPPQQQQPGGHRQQPRDSRDQGNAAQLPGCPHSPRSPTRQHGIWWVTPDHIPPADNLPGSTAAASPPITAVTTPPASVRAASANKRDEITSAWSDNSCSSRVGSPLPAALQSSMQLQMQQLPLSVEHSGSTTQPVQQQRQPHAQLPQEQLPLLRQRSSVLPISTGAPQQRHVLRWWLVGGVALAALSGSAVVVAYGVMSYMMKAAMVYSFAWKAATGVAAAEGLALGGWGCSSVRKEKAAAKQSAVDLSRARNQAARELAALTNVLQQRDMAHKDEVAALSAANERLTRLAQSLRSENGNLQSALDRAAAERKSLEAAAALECSRAETSAVVSLAATHSERLVGEVSELRAMLLDLKEDLLGLVSEQAAVGQLTGEQTIQLAAVDGQLGRQLAVLGRGSSSGELPPAASADAQSASNDDAQQERAVSRASSGGSEDSVPGIRSGLARLKSVRGKVDAALAASIAETLEL